MKRSPRDLKRYTASERANHWVVAISFVLLALSGLAFFHPAFYPLTQLFGGGPWTRILHPYIGVVMALAFILMVIRFWQLNIIEARDRQWIKEAPKLVTQDHHVMPEQGKYNGGQKLLFWLLVASMLGLTVSGALMWRAWWDLPIELVRASVLLHAVSAFALFGLIILHVYAAIWTRGTMRAMIHGTVNRAWAKHHHPLWYRKMTGEKK